MQMLVSAIPRRQKRITGINVSDTGGAGIREGGEPCSTLKE